MWDISHTKVLNVKVLCFDMEEQELEDDDDGDDAGTEFDSGRRWCAPVSTSNVSHTPLCR